ncbi:hypothetical protein FS837_011768 [Tulasnella sp. UAMH 9824]|nr:hypothetical protein FS837_011768 [Tulasnella sp. UAMH 9824]
MSGVLSYGPDIRDPGTGSRTPSRVGRPRSGEVLPDSLPPSRSPITHTGGGDRRTRLSVHIDDRDPRNRSSTSTPQLPSRVSDSLDDPAPDHDFLLSSRGPSSPSMLPRSVSNPASPSDPLPGPTSPFSQPATSPNHLPTTPFFPFGIVTTDPLATIRPGRRPLPSVPGAQRAMTPNPLPRRVSQVLSDADRPNIIRRAHSDNGPPSNASEQLLDPTDLDWIVSRLEEDETARDVDYETILTLEEIMGPSAPAAATHQPDPLGRAGLKPSPVIEESRRYNAEGKLKLKLSLGGVRVERCGICLAQFTAGEVGLILRCKHPFHATCMEKWASIKETCPICRNPLGSDPT